MDDMNWNVYKYRQFAQESSQPAEDLAKRVDILVRTAVDLGCGYGQSTRALNDIFHEARVTGIDRNPEMTRLARQRHPECQFLTLDMMELQGQYDLVFSNADLQWIPDHEKAIPGLMHHLRDDGVLAVGFPDTRGEPLFDIMEELIARYFPDHSRWNALNAADYHRILKGCSSSFDYWETDYYYSEFDPNLLMDWLVSTRLEPVQADLEEEKVQALAQELKKRVGEAYQMDENGHILVKIHRIFFTAVR